MGGGFCPQTLLLGSATPPTRLSLLFIGWGIEHEPLPSGIKTPVTVNLQCWVGLGFGQARRLTSKYEPDRKLTDILFMLEMPNPSSRIYIWAT